MHSNAHCRIKEVFYNLVKFVYKLGTNWQTRAWDPVFKTAGSAPDTAMILGLFSRKNLKINIDRKLYWIVHVYPDCFLCLVSMIWQEPKLWSKAGLTGQGRKFFLQTPKSKIDKNHSYAIFPYKNNHHIFYDYSEINQKGPPVRKTWLK